MSMDTSSFFWLGLVASLFIGLFLTLFRTRNARIAAAQARPVRIPMVRPELWEVKVAPQASGGVADTVVRRWTELSPLAARVSIHDESSSSPQRPRRTSRWRRFRIRRWSQRQQSSSDQGHLSEDEMQVQEAQVAMLILMPSPRPPYHPQGPNLPHWVPECAVGTITYDMAESVT
ncbi:hypothetical protein NM688_g7328 [Phlebia brevispora]|uniref:Uncharacterized protein n=1 Tax=Phlebia brevispora TaxID=194682 RepID=A0ACC1S6K4_9APHY|nr:hypothetical protein NM688_g7328 [Phlebia brevispora]